MGVLLFRTVGNRRGIATGAACLWLASAFGCDTFSEPGPDLTLGGFVGSVGGVGGSTFAGTAGVSGTTATGGTGLTVSCPDVDNDFDGVSVAGPGCGAASSLGQDCNDFDPNVQLPGFVDSDGDGDGDPASPVCLPAGLPVAGFSSTGTDCDDVDPSIGSGMIDVAGDHVDRNCDGNDGTPDCTQQTWCPCDANLATSVDITNGCDGFDLVVFEVVACSAGCSDSSAYVRLANIGKRAAPWLVSVSGLDGVPHPIVYGLDPGVITQPFPWPGFDMPVVRVSSSQPGDCDPSNDLYEPPPGGLQPQCPK